jgi:tRNA (guanine-N7-)-methyltransferase
MQSVQLALPDRDLSLATLLAERATSSGEAALLDPRALLPGGAAWEVEIGFGKGRYLLASAAARPKDRFLGIEIAGEYYRLARDRARRRGLGNLLLARADAIYLLAALLPRGLARRVHVYFPDPWPKTRHHKRRLFDPETLDLLLGLLAADGELFFATDHLAYGELVEAILASHPGLDVTRWQGPWPDGARTNYEAKYLVEGRPIRRLVVRLRPGAEPVHPAGLVGLAVGAPDGELVLRGASDSPTDE